MYSETPVIEHFYNQFNGFDFVSSLSPKNDSKGNLYVHNKNQIIKIDTVFNQMADFKIDFKDVLINGVKTNISDIDGKLMPYSKKIISFRFNAIKYPINNNIHYRYKINNEGWIDGNVVNLLSLRSGDYQLLVEAFNQENMQKQSKTIIFTIKTPYWRTTWFFILLLTLLIGIALLVMRLRIHWLKTEHQKNTQLVIRNSELQLRSLQQQMNPHFLFNALQSLQWFIIEKKVEEGLVYTSTLAGLIRSNLLNASEEFIHLSSEVAFLKKYVDIEQKRFKDKLHVEFNIQVEDNNLLIPPMLIQPIIENSIKHGILNGNTQGVIKVNFKQTNEALITSIEDNGVGREYTKKLDKREHNNKGLEIIKQRLNLLNTKHLTNIHQIIFTDLHLDGKPAGTRVEVHLMLKHS